MTKHTAWRNGTLGMLNHAHLHDKLVHEGKRLQRLLAAGESDRCTLEYAALNFFSTCWHLYHDWLKFDKLDRPRYSSSKKRHSRERMAAIMDIVKGVTEGNTHFVACDAGEVGLAGGPSFVTIAPYPCFTLPSLVAILLFYIGWLLDEDKHDIKMPRFLLALLDEHAPMCA
jgi:hypothetical protein